MADHARQERTHDSAPSEAGAIREHELKTWPEYYAALLTGAKTFEYRKDDRGFRVGDRLRLREYEPLTGAYSGREMVRVVTYLLRVDFNEHVVIALAEARDRPASVTDEDKATRAGEPVTRSPAGSTAPTDEKAAQRLQEIREVWGGDDDGFVEVEIVRRGQVDRRERVCPTCQHRDRLGHEEWCKFAVIRFLLAQIDLLESATSDPARFTPLESGKAIGSAIHSSSPPASVSEAWE